MIHLIQWSMIAVMLFVASQLECTLANQEHRASKYPLCYQSTCQLPARG